MSDVVKPDTSEAAVETRARKLASCGHGFVHDAACLRALLAERDAAKADVERLGRELNTSRYGPKHFGEDFHEKFGADLLAERNAAVIARDDAIRRLADAARDAGRWRGISEGNDVVIKHLRAERDALRAALWKRIRDTNECIATECVNPPEGHCGCYAEMQVVLREAGHE